MGRDRIVPLLPGGGPGIRVMVFVVRLSIPNSVFPLTPVNQMLPSGPVVIPPLASVEPVGRAISVLVLVVGLKTPIEALPELSEKISPLGPVVTASAPFTVPTGVTVIASRALASSPSTAGRRRFEPVFRRRFHKDAIASVLPRMQVMRPARSAYRASSRELAKPTVLCASDALTRA